jgi:hypothetical protein
MPKNAEKYICEKCDFRCSKLSNFNIHIKSKKHNTTITTKLQQKQQPQIYECICGKQYNHRASLYNHKKKCNYQTEKKHTIEYEDTSNTDMTNMTNLFIMFLKSQSENQDKTQDNMNKMITGLHENQNNMTNKIIKEVIKEVIPMIGNDHHNTTNTNSHNNTLNFYLTNTCKDAESITDFTSRFCERIETFFNGNYDKIAHNKISLADNVQTIFFECMDDKTQNNRFIQTTDKKNGIFYVKEQKKDEENKLVGDAEFVKYKDGFDKHGEKLGHAIHKTINPCKEACIPKLEQTIQAKPNEEDYEDFDDYEKAYDNYRISTSEIKENLMFQTHYAMNLFDNKQVRDKTLSETKRLKDA